MAFSFPSLLHTKPDVPYNSPRWGNLSGPISEQLDLVACLDQVQDDLDVLTGGVAAKTDSHILELTDAEKLVTVNAGTNKTVTVPPNADVAFPVGSEVAVARLGAGEVDIVAGSGVTIRSANSYTRLVDQYSACSLVKLATNEWLLVGNLEATP